MRLNNDDNNFDLSDVRTEDSLDDVLDVAVEVLGENAPDPGNTRIERMSRWIVRHLGGEPFTMEEAGAITRFTIREDFAVWRVGSLVGFGSTEAAGRHIPVDTDQGRATVVALIRALERAESY